MTKATAGAAATMTTGNATATVRTRTASRRASATSGDDSSMTGNKVKADIDHSDTSRTPANGAIAAGVSSTAQNAAAAKLRRRRPCHVLDGCAARPRYEQHEQERQRDIGDAAREITERGGERRLERTFPVQGDRIRERSKAAPNQPSEVRRQRERPHRDRHPRH